MWDASTSAQRQNQETQMTYENTPEEEYKESLKAREEVKKFAKEQRVVQHPYTYPKRMKT